MLEKVAEFLNDNFYQTDFDFYKKGGVSKIDVSEEQAANYLDNVYKARRKILPEKTSEKLDGILCSGVSAKSIPPTLTKRLLSLMTALSEQGLDIETVYILCKNDEMKNCSEKFIREQKKTEEVFAKINFKFVVANVDRNIGKTCVEKLEKEKAVKNPYIVITDATSAPKDYGTARGALEQKCHGVALDPIRNWKNEMESYGYTKAKAWALSAMNFVARQAIKELEKYKPAQEK